MYNNRANKPIFWIKIQDPGKMKSGEVTICIPRPCPTPSTSIQLSMVVLSIGAASHFMLFLDSVVDNLLPAAMPFLLTIYKTKEEADVAWEQIVASRMYGLAVGCFLSILFPPKIGRKFPVIVGTIMDIVGVILAALTVYLPGGITAAVVGRFINGCGQGIVQTSGSVMLAEIPPLRKRGTALATLTMWACLGELSGMLISLEEFLGRPTRWHMAMAVPLLPLIPALYLLWSAPESPRFLFMENRESEARKALAYYQSSTDARQTMEEIMQEIKLRDDPIDINSNNNAKKKSPGPDSLTSHILSRFKDGYFARPLLIALFVQSFVHLDDWLWISYSTQIFENNGLTASKAQRASLFMSLPQAAISVALLGCFDNFSRRTLLIIPTCASVLFGTLAIAFTYFEKVLLRGIPLALVLPVLASFDLSSAAIAGESAFAIVPELFLQNDKVLGTAIVGIVQNVFGGVLTNFLLTAVNKLGTHNVLVPFVIMNAVYVVVNYKYLPETAEKTPQEVSIHFSPEPPFKQTISAVQKKLSETTRYIMHNKIFTINSFVHVTFFVAQVIICAVIMNLAYHLGLHLLQSVYTGR